MNSLTLAIDRLRFSALVSLNMAIESKLPDSVLLSLHCSYHNLSFACNEMQRIDAEIRTQE
jgi:hypothetical protein